MKIDTLAVLLAASNLVMLAFAPQAVAEFCRSQGGPLWHIWPCVLWTLIAVELLMYTIYKRFVE